MKKIILSATAFVLSVGAFAGDPSAKVLAAFQRQFPNAANVHWHSEGKTALAYFTKDNVTYSLAYDGKGRMQSGVRYYGEAYLPFQLKTDLLSRYEGLSVYGVTSTLR